MTGLQHPQFLLALAALGIPVVIHLLSRKEGNVILMGSLRHLPVSSTRRFKSIRLNERLLLSLRCIMIVLMVLLLCGIRWDPTSYPRKWALFEQDAENDSRLKTIRDSLGRAGYELRSLRSDFPLLSERAERDDPANYWLLSRQLRSLPLADVIVFSTFREENFRGQRSDLPPNQRWVELDPRPAEFLVDAVLFPHDSVRARIGHSSSSSTEYQTRQLRISSNHHYFKLPGEAGDSIPVRTPSATSVDLISDESHQRDRNIIVAAIRALQVSFADSLILSEKKTSVHSTFPHFTIWLSGRTPHISDSSCAIILKEDPASATLFRKQAESWQLTRRLTGDVAVNENLTANLAMIFFASPALDERGDRRDQRTMPTRMAWSPAPSRGQFAETVGQTTSSAEYWLLLLLLTTLLTERLIAFKRNQ